MNWYKKLSINQKINLKEIYHWICGITWEQMTMMGFTFKEKVDLVHEKLQLEGFEV